MRYCYLMCCQNGCHTLTRYQQTFENTWWKLFLSRMVLREIKSFTGIDGEEFPEEIVDGVVESSIVHKDYFDWNLRLADKPVCCNVEGNKPKSKVIPTEQTYVGGVQHRLC